MKKFRLLFFSLAIFYASPSFAAPVIVSQAFARGYGLDLDLNVSAKAQVAVVNVNATVSGGLNTPLGLVSNTSPGTAFNQHASAVGVTAILGGVGGASLVQSVLGIVTPVVGSSSVIYGNASYNPSSSTATGIGGLSNTSLSIGTNGSLFSISGGANSLFSTSSVTVDEATGAFTTMASSTLAGATIKVLGTTLSTAVTPSGPINIDLLAGTPLAGLGVLTSGLSAKVFFNEQTYYSDGVLSSSCVGATYSCSVATNALRIKIANLSTNVSLLSLANVKLDTDLDIIIGRSVASLTVISAVPEPENLLMLLTGFALIAVYSKRRKMS